jgi:hypothetical protein
MFINVLPTFQGRLLASCAVVHSKALFKAAAHCSAVVKDSDIDDHDLK